MMGEKPSFLTASRTLAGSTCRPAFFVRPHLEDTAQLPPWHVAANELGDLVPGNRWQSVGYARSGGRATEVTLQHFVILHLRPPGLPRRVPLGPGASRKSLW